MSQEIFCDACGISVSWSNIIQHCKNSVRRDKNVELFISKKKMSIQTLCTTNEMEAELPNVAGQTLRPNDKIARLEFTKMIAQSNIGSLQSQYIKKIHTHL